MSESDIKEKKIKHQTELLGRLIQSETKGETRGCNSKESKNLQQFVEFLYKNDNLPVIVFCFSRDQCEQYGATIANSVRLINKPEKNRISHFYGSVLQRLKEQDRDLTQIRQLRTYLHSGIGVHHAGMLPILKEAVEMLFSEGLIKILFATTTFAMGVNMPARTVAFLKTKKRNNRGELSFLDASEYLQMAGRAGRRGKDSKGTVIIFGDTNSYDGLDMKGIRPMFEDKGVPLESKFRLTYKMMLHLLQAEHVSVKDIMHYSFRQFNTMKEIIRDTKRKNEVSARLAISYKKASCGCELSDVEAAPIEFLYNLNEKIAANHKADLVIGRIILVFNNEYFMEPAMITSLDAAKLKVVISASQKPVKNPKEQELTAKFKGEMKTGGFFEYAEIEYANIIKILNYVFKQDTVVNSRTQAENIAERIQEYYGVKKVPEVKVNKNSANDTRTRQESLKNLMDKPMMKCEYKMQHLAELEQIRRDKKELSLIEASLSAVSIEKIGDYNKMLEVLRRLNYIDSNNMLLIKGKVAKEITCRETLIMTELLFDRGLRDLEPEELVALVSPMVIEEKKDKFKEISLSDNFAKMQEILFDCAHRLFTVEKECEVDQESESYMDRLFFSLSDVIYYWAQGKDFKFVSDLTPIHEGSIVRGIMRIEYILRELKNAAGVMGDSKLKLLLEQAQERIKRDIIFTPSLYIQ